MTQEEEKEIKRLHRLAAQELIDVIEIRDMLPELKGLERKQREFSIQEITEGMNKTFHYHRVAQNFTNDHYLQVKFDKVLEIANEVVQELKSTL